MSSSKANTTKTILIGTSLRDSPVPHHFAALGRELVNSGYQVALLVHGPVDKAAEMDPQLSVMKWPSPRPTRVADMLFFNRLVRRLRPCCLISMFGSRNIMMTIGGLRRVPVRIHWHHTLSSQIDGDWAGSRMKLWLLRLRARIPFHFVTHAIANSCAAKVDLIKVFGVPAQKCQVFWNALEDPLSHSALTLTPEAAAPDSRRFVCVGRFAASKGQDVLLKAMAQVVSRHPDATVEFIGGGSTRVACEEMARKLGLGERCRFLGALPHSEVLSRMAGAFAVIVPSRNEAFGLVNIESMSVGVPVIGSNTGGIAEIVRDGVDGFLFPPGDHDALATRMMGLLKNGSLRAQMAASARRRFLEHFESTRAVKEQARWIIEQVSNAVNCVSQPRVVSGASHIAVPNPPR
jgi:glycosyltransferase involved in cell wall biosynthesis